MTSPANLPIPPGGDQDRGWHTLAVQSSLSVIAIVFVVARIYTRSIILRCFGIDDGLLILGTLCVFVVFVLEICQYNDGWGRHAYYLLQTPQSQAKYIEALKFSYIDQTLLIISIFFVKASIGIFLLRIFGTKRVWHWVIYSIIGLLFFTTVFSAAMTLGQCRPAKKIWNPNIPGTCFRPSTIVYVGYFNGAVAAFTDWFLASLPIYFIWKMQMSLSNKLGIGFLMSLGYFVGIAAIIRAVELKNLSAIDISWDITGVDCWAAVESRLCVIAACAPTIRPLYSSSVRGLNQGWKKIRNTRTSRTIKHSSDAPKAWYGTDFHSGGLSGGRHNIARQSFVNLEGGIGTHQVAGWRGSKNPEDAPMPYNAIRVERDFVLNESDQSSQRLP